MTKEQKMKQYEFIVHLFSDETGRLRMDLDRFTKNEMIRIKNSLQDEIQRIETELGETKKENKMRILDLFA